MARWLSGLRRMFGKELPPETLQTLQEQIRAIPVPAADLTALSPGALQEAGEAIRICTTALARAGRMPEELVQEARQLAEESRAMDQTLAVFRQREETLRQEILAFTAQTRSLRQLQLVRGANRTAQLAALREKREQLAQRKAAYDRELDALERQLTELTDNMARLRSGLLQSAGSSEN